MRYEQDIEDEIDSLMYERDTDRFDRRLDILEDNLRRRHLFYFYTELDPRQKLIVAVDLLSYLLCRS